MEPKFTISKTERLFIDDKFICNGHWLVTRNAAHSPMAPKPLKPLLAAKHGTYYNGINAGPDKDDAPDMTRVIPKRDGYKKIAVAPVSVNFAGDRISAYKYDLGEGAEIGIDPRYVPLLKLGHVFAKDSTSPVLVLDGETLNDDLLAVVMPVRL